MDAATGSAWGEPLFRESRPRPFCLVLEPSAASERDLSSRSGSRPDLLHEVLLAPERREAFFSFVDSTGLVVVRGVHADPSDYRDVRGRSSRGRLSQGEYFHHDGCSGPTKPRIVEIRCPHQDVARTVATAIAPFPDTLYAMLRELPRRLLEDPELQRWRDRLDADGGLAVDEYDLVQGLANRAIRRGLSAVAAREFFMAVDQRCNAYAQPWEMGESRFIANSLPGLGSKRTLQHRRAYGSETGRSNGKLLKRWPADDPLLAPTR